MAGQERRQDRQDLIGDAALVQRCDEDDEGMLARRGQNGRRDLLPVGIVEFRMYRGQCHRQVMDRVLRPMTRSDGTNASIGDDDIDAVTCARSQSRQQQSRLNAASKTVPSPHRRAASRDESTTMTTRRSRSGRQVLTTRSWARALARQSIERTSSPST